MTTAPDHITSTAPERIYLDLGDCAHLIKPEETFATYAQGEITWSEGNDSGVGIPYVRADLVPTPAASGAAPALTQADQIEADLREILCGMDSTQTSPDGGWWETSTEEAFGAEKLEQVIAYARALASPQVAPDTVQVQSEDALNPYPQGSITYEAWKKGWQNARAGQARYAHQGSSYYDGYAAALATPIQVAPQDDARDAARYRWLRKGHNAMVLMGSSRWGSSAQMDTAIDAAMSASTPAAKPTEPTLPTQGGAK